MKKISKRPARIKFGGRVLFLTEDPSLIRRQLEAGEDLAFDAGRVRLCRDARGRGEERPS